MNDKSKPTIGKQYEVVAGSVVKRGTLVDLLQADVVPDPEKIIRYFGKRAPKAEFLDKPFYRAVLKKANGHYMIFPLVPNRKLILVE